jgi:hypothetical protein
MLPVPRGWVFVLKTGDVVIDWGDGRVQDILTGEFRSLSPHDPGETVSDADLEALKNSGRVQGYDVRMVYLRPLPEPPRPTIE